MTNKNNIQKELLINSVLLKNKTLDSKDENSLKILRGEKTDKSVIYIGAGTCGLGAGANKTKQAAINFLSQNNIDAEIVETGCIGLCAYEPILDVHIPGFNRISFSHVSED